MSSETNKQNQKSFFVHPTAEISSNVSIGVNTKIWHYCQVRQGVTLGENCILGKGVFIDFDVKIGHNVKIQNRVSIYHGVTLEDGVFCGPHCVFTNDKQPRAINSDGSLKSADDWLVSKILVKQGASIGANATIVSGITIGSWAMIGAGSVVTKDVPSYGLVYGNPARLQGFVCSCGHKLTKIQQQGIQIITSCTGCQTQVLIPITDYQKLKG